MITAKALADAKQRADDRAARGGVDTTERSSWVPHDANGYLVTISACRADQKTPEAPQPPRSGKEKAKYFGLLTYTLYEVLTQATTPLTYAELVHRVQIRYAGRPQGAPTPIVEGNGQNREVLGVKQWPGRSNILLRKDGKGYSVTAGNLHGITVGSVLAVEGPPGYADSGKRLGHVRVEDVKMADASVKLAEYDETPAPTELPDLAVCRVVFTDYATRRISLAVDVPDERHRKQILTR